jgi:xanthine dehydrogenase accessory factor
MAGFDIFDEIARLREAGRPFAVATVVRTADVTSAKAGAKAAVTEAGDILGHLGGGCVRGAVRRASAEALASGAARMIRIKPAASVLPLIDADGAALYRSGCPSGGTVDVLIEPFVPPPMLALIGTTPVAVAIAAHARLMGFRLASEIPDAGVALDPADLGPLALGPRDFVVIAAQGQGDLAALRAAMASPCDRVAMVASRRKAAWLADRLRAEGITDDTLARLKSPAGLDLGGIDPHEIAVSVLAEIVQWRNAARATPQTALADQAV